MPDSLGWRRHPGNLILNAAEAVREVPPERRRLVVRSTFERPEDALPEMR